ncbi:MAG: WD40 repeat domain-containing protein [Proteobacteria bacterium]|nr:MAG: WD40 repeat domain-containing protein [Pseudomonadota bacterium]
MSKENMKLCISVGLLLISSNAYAAKIGHHEGAGEITPSGDGKVAFSRGLGSTRVWDVERQSEMASLPTEAGVLVAVSHDGRRVLCRRGELRMERGKPVEMPDFKLWQYRLGDWRSGTLVGSGVAHPLLGATFVGNELVLFWGKTVERRDANGRFLRLVSSKAMQQNTAEPGALSTDGNRAAAFQWEGEKPLTCIFDTSSGRLLQSILREQFHYYTSWAFSPDSKVLGAQMGEPVGPWNPNDGDEPVQWSHIFWDVRTGNELGNWFGESLTFWPNDKSKPLVKTTDSTPKDWELHDVMSEKTLLLPLPFPRPWGQRPIRSLSFSRDGKAAFVADAQGDLWAERVQATPKVLR